MPVFVGGRILTCHSWSDVISFIYLLTYFRINKS